jgi:hypothetical protein
MRDRLEEEFKLRRQARDELVKARRVVAEKAPIDASAL